MTFKYHGIAKQEVAAAGAVAARAKVFEQRTVRLPDLKEAAGIPGTGFEGLPPGYIPVRNAIFYSFAASYAEEVGANAIVGGHNRDDGRVFEDVGAVFFDRLQGALLSGSERLRSSRLRIDRPLEGMTKVEVVRKAAAIGVPLELTWSCHRNGTLHCWNCPGCEARVKCFMEAGVPDPLSGASRKIS